MRFIFSDNNPKCSKFSGTFRIIVCWNEKLKVQAFNNSNMG